MRNGSKSDEGPKRGRPRSFEEDEALARIAEVFWERGFDAASLDEISARSGVARPSLYSTFGNKEEMYLRSMELFAARIRAAIATDAEGLEATLMAVFDGLLSIYIDEGQRARGCLVLCTAPTGAAAQPAIGAALQRVIESIDAMFGEILRDAQTHGELAANLDLDARAVMLSSTVHSIALRARVGTPAAELRDLAARAVRLTVG